MTNLTFKFLGPRLSSSCHLKYSSLSNKYRVHSTPEGIIFFLIFSWFCRCSERWLLLGKSWRIDKYKNGKGMFNVNSAVWGLHFASDIDFCMDQENKAFNNIFLVKRFLFDGLGCYILGKKNKICWLEKYYLLVIL